MRLIVRVCLSKVGVGLREDIGMIIMVDERLLGRYVGHSFVSTGFQLDPRTY